MFCARVIGLWISRSGDGSNVERRPVGTNGCSPSAASVLELVVRFIRGPSSKNAYEQLTNLEPHGREPRSRSVDCCSV